MRRRSFLIPGILTAIVSGALWAADRSEVTYDQVCSYDSQRLCAKLQRQPDGSIVKPNPELLRIVSDLAHEIHVAAKKFDVDPVVIAATILAENTMNVNVADKVQNWLVANSILPNGSVLGKSFSLGLGQINHEAAMPIEPLVAKAESRPQRDVHQVLKALLTPEGSFTYNAAIQRHAIDQYKSIGVGISNRPAIVATLYNLGRIEQKKEALRSAREAAKTKNQPLPEPRPNYFGYFVGQYYDLAAQTLGTEEEAKKRAQLKTLTSSVSAPADLLKIPPFCDPNKGISPENTAAASGTGRYRVLSRTIDCDMTPFSLVEFENGAIGWILSEKLDHLTTRVATPKLSVCKPKVSIDCSRSLQSMLRTPIPPEDSIVYSDLQVHSNKQKIRSNLYPKSSETYNYSVMSAGWKTEILHLAARTRATVFDPKASYAAVMEDLAPSFDQWVEHIRSCEAPCRLSNTKPSVLADTLYRFRDYPTASLTEIKQFVASRPGTPLPRNKIYGDEVRKLENECKPLVETAKRIRNLGSGSGEQVDMLVGELQSISMNLPFASSEAVEKSKYRQIVARLFEEIRLECRAFSACQEGKLGSILSGTQCTLERDIQKLDFLCQFGTAGIMTRVANRMQQITCFFPELYDGTSNRCNYDTEGLLEHVQKIADLSCVKRVIVPDRFVANEEWAQQNDAFKSKVIFGEGLSGKMAIQLEEECSAQK